MVTHVVHVAELLFEPCLSAATMGRRTVMTFGRRTVFRPLSRGHGLSVLETQRPFEHTYSVAVFVIVDDPNVDKVMLAGSVVLVNGPRKEKTSSVERPARPSALALFRMSEVSSCGMKSSPP